MPDVSDQTVHLHECRTHLWQKYRDYNSRFYLKTIPKCKFAVYTIINFPLKKTTSGAQNSLSPIQSSLYKQRPEFTYF